MLDKETEKALLDLGLVNDYSDSIAQYYRLQTMGYHILCVYKESGDCDTPSDLYMMDDGIVSSINTKHFRTAEDSIPHIKDLIRRYKALMVELKRRELEQDFENE